MIYDILEVFKKEYEDIGDKLILDNYKLKDGLYVKVNKDYSISYFISKKKNRESIFTDLDGGLNNSAYEWLKERDYYSSYLNSNKSFSDKKLHNINYLSLFVKIESFISKESKKLLDENAIKNQYKHLCNYKKFIKFNEKEILKSYQNFFKDRTRRKDIIDKYKFIRDNLQKIVEIAIQNGVTNYIKIFFDEEIEKYKKESKPYYAIKIFNDIGYSKEVEDKIFGLSDSNMGLNSKKPYLEQKTKKIIAPFMICKDDALLTKKFFDWLKFQDFKDKTPLANELFLRRDFKEKDLIIDFDYLPVKISKLDKPINIKNHLLLKKEKILLEDETIEYLNILEEKIDEVLYNRQLTNNYYGEVYKKLDNEFASLIYITRDAMVGYFKKYDGRAFYQVIEKYASYLAIEHVVRGRFLQAGLSLNLKFSILAHKGEEIMNIKEMQDKIITKIEDSNYDDLKSDEFFYLCGQMAYFLVSQSESSNKTFKLAEHYLKSKNVKTIKNHLRNDLEKYKHKIYLNIKKSKFKNAFAMIIAYDKEQKLSNQEMDIFLIGLISENVFYMKKEEK